MTLMMIAIALVAGTLSAALPLGPVSVIVLQRSLAGDPDGALRIGLGRAPAEATYCALATFGMAALLDQVPGARVAVGAVGSLFFTAIGVWLLLQKPRDPKLDPPPPKLARWGNWTGFIIAGLNLSLLISWSTVVALIISMGEIQPTLVQKIVFPLSLGVGICVGYVLWTRFLGRHGDKLDVRIVRWGLRGLGLLFVFLATWNLVKLLA